MLNGVESVLGLVVRHGPAVMLPQQFNGQGYVVDTVEIVHA